MDGQPIDFAPSKLNAVADHYSFPDATGAGERVALIELSGGYHEADLEASFSGLSPQPVVTPIFVEVLDHGLPLYGTNSPLDVSMIASILDAMNEHGATFASLSERFEPQMKAWSEFLYTLEVTMDVQIVGGLAPGAAIDVYFSSLSAEGMAAAINCALKSDPTVISISWGGAESWWLGPHGEQRAAVDLVSQALAAAHAKDITVCCASGDWGASGQTLTPDDLMRVNFPASSPYALACGGTSLQPGNPQAGIEQFVGETVWNETILGLSVASGGGMSGLFARPDYQNSLAAPSTEGSWLDQGHDGGFKGRLLPDVAAHAAHANGYPLIVGGRPYLASGTSASCPVWAALLTRLSEKMGRRVGWVNERLYGSGGAGCRPIIVGGNGRTGSQHGYSASPGWDPCTGWGSPDGAGLLALLSS